MRTKKIWAFRLGAAILGPLILFVCLEGSLRLGQYGASPEIATASTIAGTSRYCNNPRLGWRFFPKTLARELDAFAFDRVKAPNTYRVFILGASAAQGVPDENYHFGRLLECMLAQEYAGTDFEVINLGMTAINSHAVYTMARSCLRFEPDLLIVYLGNNEVIGPFGPGTFNGGTPAGLGVIRAKMAIKGARTGQLLQSIRSLFPDRDGVPETWGGMGMYLDHQIRHGSGALERVYAHFEQNLRDICDMADRDGVPLLLSTVACNLKDSPPFASQHREDLPDEARQVWEQHYREGLASETAAAWNQAILHYQEAEQIDETYADLQFRLGRCHLRSGNAEQAYHHFVQARDFDTLRFRADARVNAAICTVADENKHRGVYLVDAEKAVAANSPNGIAGKELFYEHVHLRFQGNYVLARMVFDTVEDVLPQTISSRKRGLPPLTLAQCQARLVYNGLDQYHSAQAILDMMRKPPFVNQSYHAAAVKELEREADASKQEMASQLKPLIQIYRQRLQQYPDDWRLRWKVADYSYHHFENDGLAAMQAEKILESLPYAGARRILMRIATKEGRLDDADRYARRLVSDWPARVDYTFDHAEIFKLRGEYERAINQFEKGLGRQRSAESVVAYTYLSQLYEMMCRPEKAARARRDAGAFQ